MSDGARTVAGVLCLLVLIASVPVVAQSTPQAGIGEVSVSGGGVITGAETGNGSTYIWRGEPVNVSVTFTDYPDARNYLVRIGYEREGAPAKALGRDLVPLSAGTNGTAEFSNVSWPANATGRQGLVVEIQSLSNESNATTLDRKTVPVTVLRKGGDFDNDGLTNAVEVEQGYNVSNPDMDADGLPDGAEVNQYGSNPQRADSDSDGIRDGVEIQQGTNASTSDTDGDGLSDRFETTGLLRTDPTDSATVLWLAITTLVGLFVLAGVFVVVRRVWRERFGGSVVTSDGDSGAGAATTDDEERPTPEPPTEPTPEPLTDEDRVLGLLREHGGRMRQSQIVDETEWSKAKVSRLLSAMNEEDSIEKLSIGRENIISLDGQGPEAARPPHEENATD